MAGNYLGLFSQPSNQLDPATVARRQQEIQIGQMSPDQQMGVARQMAAGNAGAGAAQMVRAVAGDRGPEAKREEVRRKVQAALRGKDATSPEVVYPILIAALHEAGLVAEAMEATREFEEVRGKAEDRATRAENAATNRKKAEATGEFLRAKAAALQTSPKERILADYAATLGKLEGGEYKDDAEKLALQRLLVAQERALGVKPEKQGGTWKVTIQQGNATDPARVIKYNTVTGETTTETLDGKPLGTIQAEAAAKQKPQNQKPLGGKQLEDLAEATGNVETLVRLSTSFKPTYVLPQGAYRFLSQIATAGGFGDKVQLLQRLFGKDQEAAAWWSAYADLMTHVRHDLFGATLTTGESAAFDLIKALLAQPPQATADKVKEQAKGTHYKLTGIAGTLGQEWGLGDLEARLAALAPQVEALRGKTVGAYTERPSAASAAPAPAAGASKPTVSNW